MRRSTLTAAATVATLALALPACLESGRGQIDSDTAGADTRQGDTSTGDAVTDPCLGRSCDDQDPCTWDECDAQTGECQHYAVPSTGVPVQGCGGDWDCDDGDPCTADRCAGSGDGCGIAWSACEHEPVPGCADCHQLGCPTSDPCAVGTCHDDGSCTFEQTPGCGSQCSSVGALSPTEARLQLYPGDSAKIAGGVVPNPYTVCLLGGGCACLSEPALIDDLGASVALYAPTSGGVDASEWACREDTCGGSEQPACGPVHYGAAYWVWGTASALVYASPRSDGAPHSDPALPPLPEVEGLVVADYCLQTNANGLPGVYKGQLTSAHYTQTLDLVGVIAVNAVGGLELTLREPTCENCSPTWGSSIFPQTVPLTAGDGWVSFDLAAPTSCSAIRPPARATLFSQRNALAGDYHDPVGDGDAGEPGAEVPYCSWGRLSLTRLP